MFLLSKHVEDFEAHKKEIARLWTKKEIIVKIFAKKSMDIEKFESMYAIGVIEYFLGVLTHTKELGNCPIMHAMLTDFAEHNITSQEIFFICSQFKRTMMSFAFEQNFASEDVIDEINFLLDENFGGVIKRYDEIIHAHVRELEENEKRFLEYTNVVDKGTIISKTDPYGIITYVNKEFEEVSGYSSDELVGNAHSIVRHPDMPKGFFEELWQTLKNKEIFYGTIKNLHKSGSAYFVKSCIAPILDVNDEIVEFISIRQDITDLMNAIEKEHKINLLKDDFLRNMSHEVRTPLNAISGAVNLLRRNINDPKLEKYVTLINNGTHQLLEVMSHVLELSQLSSGTYDANIKTEVLYHQIEHACDRYRILAEKKGLLLECRLGSGLKQAVTCDIHLINRILDGLTDNAIKFTDGEGKVVISVNYDGFSLDMKVEDTGSGISSEKLEEIYKPFHQIDNSTVRRHDGIGVGLTLIKKIVDYLKGDINVLSYEGEGTQFTVKIPLPKA